MHPHERLIEAFYTACKASDPAGMAACYHPDIEFSDPAFPVVRGKRVAAMWAMRLGQLKADPEGRTFSDIHADDARGTAHWEARYIFPTTGRPVHNRIDARFEFAEGKIRRHAETFDFWLWSRQAFGAAGVLLGWGPLKPLVQRNAAKTLDQFLEEHPELR